MTVAIDTAPRNIVICCDGTANEFSADRTNVVKLYYALQRKSAGQSERQIAYYHPGLGTMEPQGALTPFARKVTRLLGMAVGYGLSLDIGAAYIYLMNNYRPGDRVFLFGFSRGAYTARAVCSLLTLYGLLPPGNDAFVPYAIRMMLAIRDGARRGDAEQDAHVAAYFQLAADFKASMGRTECKPYFCGVWDTVSSVGWFDNALSLPFTADNPDIEIGRHAIALDERRAFFRTNLWRPNPRKAAHGPKDMLQVWFAGVHSDVGGGYPEEESGLSKIALEWMLQEAKAAGLLVDRDRQAEVLGRSAGSRYAAPDADGELHESLVGAWKLAEEIPKPHYDFATGQTTREGNQGKRRTVPPGAWVHVSVFEREGGEYAKRIGLPKDARPVATLDDAVPAAGP